MASYTFLSEDRFRIPSGYKPQDSSACYLLQPSLLEKDPKKTCLLVHPKKPSLTIAPSEFSLQLLSSPRENPLKLHSSVPLSKDQLASAMTGCDFLDITPLSDGKTFLLNISRSCILRISKGSLRVNSLSNQEFIKNVFTTGSLVSSPVEEKTLNPKRAQASLPTTTLEASSLEDSPTLEMINEPASPRIKTSSVQRKISSIESQELPKEELIPSFSPWEDPFQGDKLIDVPIEQEKNF